METTHEKPSAAANAEAKADSPAMYGSDASPALTHQSKHYPERFGGRVPLQIKMLMTVRPDPWCSLARVGKPGTILREGQIYTAWTNSHGAVCGWCCNGEKLGVKPDEFEVVSWHDGKHQNAEVSDRRAHGNDNTTGANGGSLH